MLVLKGLFVTRGKNEISFILCDVEWYAKGKALLTFFLCAYVPSLFRQDGLCWGKKGNWTANNAPYTFGMNGFTVLFNLSLFEPVWAIKVGQELHVKKSHSGISLFPVLFVCIFPLNECLHWANWVRELGYLSVWWNTKYLSQVVVSINYRYHTEYNQRLNSEP